MITQSEAWGQYNQLANAVREAIVRLAIEKVNIGAIPEFRFVDYNLNVYTSVAGSNYIVGIVKEDNEVKLIFETELATDDTFSLYSESVHLLDLMGVLENLEAYAV